MTQFVTNQVSTATKNHQKHTDPPGLWIILFFGSVLLHLLAFWLLSQYQVSSTRKQNSSSVVPIEFINISSTKKSSRELKRKTKPKSQKKINSVSQKLNSSQKLDSAPPPQRAKIYDENKNTNDIDVVRKKQLAQQKRQEQLAQQKRQEQLAQQQLQEKLAQQKRQEQFAQQQLQEKLAQQKRQEQLAQQQRQQESKSTQQSASSDLPANTGDKNSNENPTSANNLKEPELQEPELQEHEDLPEVPTPSDRSFGNDISDNLREGAGQKEDLAQNPISPNESDITTDLGKTLPELNIGGIVATFEPKPELATKNIPEVPARPKDKPQEIPLSSDIRDTAQCQQENFLAWLVIDIQGKAYFAELDPKSKSKIPPLQREKCRKYVDEILKNQQFEPATNTDPVTGEQKPVRSDLPIQIKIKRSQP